MLLSTKSLAALLAAAFSLSTACAGDDADTPADSATTVAAATPAAAPVAAAEPAAPLDLCTLVPVADVARILGETAGLTVVASTPSTGGGCSYRDRQTGAPDVKVLLDFTTFPAAGDATGALAAAREMYAERSIAMEPVAGLGDEAFAASTGGTDGIKLRRGRYLGQVNLNAEGADPAKVRAAVKALAETVVQRLP